MPILVHIIEWIEDKPKFWQEAVNRIIRNNDLTDGDINDLVNICKSENGISDLEFDVVDIEELKALVENSDSEETVTLSKICNTENINALKEGEELEFAPNGLTVIYGDNGSGKSSYVSVLKHICNTRGIRPTINSNLFVENSDQKQQVAELEYNTESGSSGSVVWKDNHLNDRILQVVDVFDTQSANHYIEDEDEIAFIPSGLIVLEKLAQCCKKVEERINTDKGTLIASSFDFSFLIGEYETEVSKFLQTLSNKTKIEELKTHTNHTEESEARIKELGTSIIKLKAKDPKKVIEDNNKKIRRFNSLKDRYRAVETGFTEKTLTDSKTIINTFFSASEISKTASEKAFSNLPIENVGNEYWKTLWESARKFYNHSVGDTIFPNTDENSNCPLCLQDLGDDAKERFNNFETFVKADLQQQLDVASTKLEEWKNYYANLDFDFTEYTPTIDEIEELIEGFTVKQASFINALNTEQKKILKLYETPKIIEVIEIPEFESTPITVIETLVKTLQEENIKLSKASVEEELKLLESEFRNLSAIKELQKYEKQITDEINRKRSIESLKKCTSQCRTTNITICSNGITDTYITSNLKENFKAELRKLGFKNINVVANTKGAKGKQYHYLQLDTSYGVNISLKDILSEGEHRCISLATFFSELSISEHKSAIIFDDPVSSLDHRWRDKISKRIIEESQERQVIVFTHDITFLMRLQEFANKQDCDIEIKSLTRKKTETGILAKNPPWDALPVKARVGVLNAEFQTLEKIENTETEEVYREKVKLMYGLMRETWERLVEELLLNGTIQRFGREVQTLRLKKVIDLTEEDYQKIKANMSKCSTMFSGHDSAGELIQSLPDTEEVNADLEILKAYAVELKKRRN
ncbi:AAA family ATPase [Xanthomarina spongicola]|uniref:Wobble nucleotide-excising tRNase n=1 Tax=Xanthomarina spongicola TaxID=570520 RepID=A0A316DGU3_9FLAO|nr:AAA family ATPase [Xanthomarina spongicola]PWK17105.1 wobble nucleotide-excising tRNase [Xanthomarina spongicola]